VNRFLLVSADNHAGPPVETYRDFMEAAYHGDLDDYLRTSVSVADKVREFGGEERLAAHAESKAGMWDSDRRIKELERDGVVAEIVFPDGTFDNEVPFTRLFGEAGASRYPLDVQAAGQRAYNRWLADFCAQAPARRGGLALVSYHDVDAAVAEVRWAADAGMRGVLVPGIPYGSVAAFGPDLDPLWAACVDTGMTVNIHGGVGAPEYEFGSPATLAIFATESTWYGHRPFWFMVWSGVFVRFPELRVAFTEQFADWIPRALGFMDWFWEEGPQLQLAEALTATRPSEVWARNCKVGASVFSLAECEMRHEIGVDTVMFGTDFPHDEGSNGRTAALLAATFGVTGVTVDEASAMLSGNAVDFYRFDEAALRRFADQAGPTLAEVLTPPAEDARLGDATAQLSRRRSDRRRGFTRSTRPPRGRRPTRSRT
jgi:predicted TIM-barrel fold metal-dependent hydrolase